jgi:hypothetical protein
MQNERDGNAKCVTCIFFKIVARSRNENNTEGTCRRFPKSQAKAGGDWCGEHKQKGSARD